MLPNGLPLLDPTRVHVIPEIVNNTMEPTLLITMTKIQELSLSLHATSLGGGTAIVNFDIFTCNSNNNYVSEPVAYSTASFVRNRNTQSFFTFKQFTSN